MTAERPAGQTVWEARQPTAQELRRQPRKKTPDPQRCWQVSHLPNILNRPPPRVYSSQALQVVPASAMLCKGPGSRSSRGTVEVQPGQEEAGVEGNQEREWKAENKERCKDPQERGFRS